MQKHWPRKICFRIRQLGFGGRRSSLFLAFISLRVLMQLLAATDKLLIRLFIASCLADVHYLPLFPLRPPLMCSSYIFSTFFHLNCKNKLLSVLFVRLSVYLSTWNDFFEIFLFLNLFGSIFWHFKCYFLAIVLNFAVDLFICLFAQ